MFEFIFQEQNFLYNVAIGVVLGLGLLEGLGLLLGMSLMAAFDNLSPIDLDFELDANTADVTGGGLTQLLGWLCLNRLPLLVWIVLFLTCFAIVGYVTNYTTASIIGYVLPTIIIAPASLFVGLFLTGRIGHRLANVMPQNESSAVSSTSFDGKLAVITSGTAKVGSPTEAKLTDDFKQSHYIMVEPLEQEQTFTRGDEVILVQKTETCWQAVSTK
jgi:hypothetical protein